MNLIGDYAGGSLFLVMGMLAALLEAGRSGKGQVVDAAITDGSASLMSLFYSLHGLGAWQPNRQSNFLDGAAHYYETYATADGKAIAIGAIEPHFYDQLISKTQLDGEAFSGQNDPARWPHLKEQLTQLFKQKSRDEWCEILEGTDACFAPVLDYMEAPKHPHNIARKTFINVGDIVQPAPAPKFSRSVCPTPSAPPAEGQDTRSVLSDWGVPQTELDALERDGGFA